MLIEGSARSLLVGVSRFMAESHDVLSQAHTANFGMRQTETVSEVSAKHGFNDDQMFLG